MRWLVRADGVVLAGHVRRNVERVGHRPRRHRSLGRAGRRLLRLRERRVVQEHRDPGGPRRYGAGAIVYDCTSRRTVELIQQAAAGRRQPRSVGAQGRRLLHELHGRSRHRDEGAFAVQPKLDAIAAIADARGARPRARRTLRADVDALNATNFYTDNLFGVWVAQDLDDPTRYVPFLLQGGLDMPDRAYYVDAAPRDGRDPRRSARRTSPRCSSWPGSRTLRRRQRASSTSRADRAGPRDAARIRRTSGRATTTGRAPTSPAKAPGIDWDELLRGRGPRQPDEFVVWHPGAVTGHRGARGERAARDLEGLPRRSTRSSTSPRCCPTRSARRLRVPRHGADRHAEAPRALEARGRRGQRGARRGGRASCTSSATSRRRPRRA